ncbi:MAG: protein kinase [Gemmatimonadaceae bacterium]|nr:protein kinase [Gemmatimonadaceae bacterium]
MPERYLGKSLGKYRVEELIGSGGFAWVYRGFDPELEIPVALKVLKPQFAGDPSFEERFRREASTAAKLRHPNIVKIYAVGRDGEAVYFAMDYLPTGLADKLESSPFLPEEFVVRVGIDVARALGFAHREGVVHRDIKVDNILFDSHGNAVVADFGIARAVTDYTNQTGTNMVVGTPQYFAPEQARAKPLDGRADIYSLGVSLFRAVAGRLPFEGDDWYQIARQHVEDPPPSPRSINPAISPAFERVLLRCLAKHPDDRPATGEQLADELTAVLHAPQDGNARASYLSPSETPTLVTPLQRISHRAVWRRAAPLTVIVLAVAATAIAVSFWRQGVPPVVAATDSLPLDTTTTPGVITATATPDTSLPGDSATKPADSLARAVRDTAKARPPATTMGRLVVTAPANARVSVNGQAVADGSWRSDSLRPGEYTVAASLPASAGCEWASVEQRVRVRAGAPATVTLSPRSCGTIAINLLNIANGARFAVVSDDGSIRVDGALPRDGGIVVPVGNYRVTAQQPLCAPYTNEGVNVTADRTTRLTFRVICEKQ